MRILVVDDERMIREGIKRTIQKEFPHNEVILAQSGEEAKQLLMEQPIHAVFLDIMMPGMTGLELLASMRSLQTTWIVVSAHSEFAFAKEALRLGAKDYILKPIGKDQIIQVVSELEKEHTEREKQRSEVDLVEQNLKYLREGVFRRWVQGMDIGHFDLASIKARHDRFHFILVKLEVVQELTLRNFIVENVMTEYINMNGSGFMVILEGNLLAGVITLDEHATAEQLYTGASCELDRCLKVPYQLYVSPLLDDFYVIPEEINKYHQLSIVEDVHSLNENSKNVIDIAQHYIHDHFQDNLSLELVASIVYLNPIYFSKLFKQKLGLGYKEYVTQLRMEHAKELLANPSLSITRIGELVGYPDVRHFTQVFRKRYERSPGQLRAEMR